MRGRVLPCRHQRVVLHVTNQGGGVEATVACGVFELLADVCRRTALPRHFTGSEVPLGSTGYIFIGAFAVAGGAAKTGGALASVAANHEGVVGLLTLALHWAVAGRVTV